MDLTAILGTDFPCLVAEDTISKKAIAIRRLSVCLIATGLFRHCLAEQTICAIATARGSERHLKSEQ